MSTTFSVASYHLIIIDGVAVFQSFNVSYINMSLSNHSLFNFAGGGSATFNEGKFWNIARVSNSGVLVSSPSAGLLNINISIGLCSVQNVSAPQATTGGVVSIINHSGLIQIVNTTCLFEIFFYFFIYFFFIFIFILVVGVTVNSSATLGGIIYIGGGTTLNLINVNISNLSAKSGAAVYASNVNANINSSTFTNLSSTNGPGGAFFFGINSGFSFNRFFILFFFFFLFDYKLLYNVVVLFVTCSSTNGNGGAIATNSSSLTLPRRITSSNFDLCVGGSENKGNDFVDINSNQAVLVIYTNASISNNQTSSNAIKFYFQALDLSMDCLLVGLCGLLSTVYVST
jgi:hypothetical protein